jgi:hypothetical protein
LQSIAADVVESVNFYVESEQAERTDRGEAFDAKVVFKSATGVRAVEYDVLQNAKRQARRDPTFLFHIAP